MSPQELAEAVNVYLYERHGVAAPMVDARTVLRYDSGENRWPRAMVREALRAVLGAATDADLGFYGGRRPRTGPTLIASGEDSPGAGRAGENEAVKRRTFVGGMAATLAGRSGSGLGGLITAVCGGSHEPERIGCDPVVAEERLVQARVRYQRCEHAAAAQLVATVLPGAQSRPSRLSAQAYQLAASLLLKAGEAPLALVAADRSVTVAASVDDPLVVASSTRALVHALSRNGYHQQAAALAHKTARMLSEAAFRRLPAAVALGGALLLRGAVAAARCDDRETAAGLLEQAHAAAADRGGDQTDPSALFGPVNVALHKVSVAVCLGDAGAAIHHARQIDLSCITSVERRACLHLDVARAHLQRDQWTDALDAFHDAERVAAEELRTRPAVHALIRDLNRRCPPTLSAAAGRLAQRIGAAA